RTLAIRSPPVASLFPYTTLFRSIDVQVFSPRASFMAHHAGDFDTSSAWSHHCNDLIGRVSELYPDRFVPSAMLPQSPGVDPATRSEEHTSELQSRFDLVCRLLLE